MKKTIFYQIRFLFIFISLTVLLNQYGCKKEEQENIKQPTLPPETSMISDFGGLTKIDTTKQKSAVKGVADIQTKWNAFWAGSAVTIWSAVLGITLVIPTAAFLESFKYEPVKLSANTWSWKYSFTLLVVHTAELRGIVDKDRVKWEMRISKEGEYQEFLWFTGNFNLDGTEGTWTLNESPKNQSSLLLIDWHKNTDGTADIKYSNIKEGNPDKGSYLTYGKTNEADYNSFFDIYSKKDDNMLNIKYNLTTHEGRIKAPKIYKDQNWHCWDSLYEDMICK